MTTLATVAIFVRIQAVSPNAPRLPDGRLPT